VVDAGMSTNYFDGDLIKAALGGPPVGGSWRPTGRARDNLTLNC